jgi:hypothetical protein
LLRDLGDSKYFSNVDLDGTKLEGGKGDLRTVSFGIRANLVNPEAKPEKEAAAPPAQKQG